ncbi:MAG: DUF1573 domain-containing protein [Pedobacter sp.]
MNKLFALACFILLQAGVFYPAMASPQIVTETPAFHFGTIAEGDKVEHIFTFTNQGDTPLIIDRVRSTCGCTGTLLSQKEVLPRQSGEVKIIFNSSGMRGPVVKWIYIYSNDPVNPKSKLQINGIVKPEIAITPNKLHLTGMTPGEKREVQISLTNNSDHTIFLSNLATSPAMTAKLSGTQLEPSATVQIHVKITIPPGKQNQNGYVTISTSSPRTPKLRIPVFAISKTDAP